MIFEELLAEMNIHTVTIPEYCYHFDQTKLKSGSSLYYNFFIDDKEVSFRQKGKEIDIKIPYIFSASSKEIARSKKDKEGIFFSLDITYNLSITLENEIMIEKELMNAFLNGVAPRILHPYFRQSVAESLQKAGLPQLNLPLFENFSEPLDSCATCD
ncbi:protein-export chaperone SecB [uncultured Sphaerochaeta sp.]|uniref:protein-export chaperone SecB n=1 Tax=uncultured Sphaerochaeta sp. TaxID=886478 RepID=UPI002AA9549A|nr:protein-export chaperone SecB [uncultured Sphaerochaeta sp.]